MLKKTDFTPSPNGSVLMIGKRNGKIEKLERFLAEYFNKIYLATDLAEGVNLSPTDIYTMIVVTDSTGHPLNKDFSSKLRADFSRSVLVCLVDQITQETEKAMRSAGLLFLGSYHEFSEQYRSILEAAINAKRFEMSVSPTCNGHREEEMRNRSLMANLLAIAILSVIFVGPGLAETITFGIYTSDKPTVIYRKFKPIIDYLQNRLTQNGGNLNISSSESGQGNIQKSCVIAGLRSTNKVLKKRLKLNKLAEKHSLRSAFSYHREFSN